MSKKDKKKKRQPSEQRVREGKSVFSKRLPLWMAPILGAIIMVFLFGTIFLLVSTEFTLPAILAVASLGALAGGLLWWAKR